MFLEGKQIKRPQRSFNLVLMAILGLLLTEGLSGCIENVKPKRKVVIFVLDDFMGEKSHGELVSDIIQKNCFGKCEIKIKDVFRRLFKEENNYLRSLKDVLKYAEEHPDVSIVVNISLGSYEYNLIEHLLIRELYDRGVIIIAAAGNDNTSRKEYPAGYKEVIAVAATSGNEKSDESNYGEHIDICALGFGSKTFVRKETINTGFYIEETKYYSIQGGTSFAAPRVTGLIAYLVRQRPELRPQQIVELVKEKAAPLKELYPYSGQLGVGKISFYRTILAGDPLYQRVFAFQIISIIVAIMCLLIIGRVPGLLSMSLVIFVPVLLVVNLVLISCWDLIKGSIIGSILIILVNLLLSLYGREDRIIEELFQKEERERMERLSALANTGRIRMDSDESFRGILGDDIEDINRFFEFYNKDQ